MAKRGFAGSPPPGKSKKARGSGKASVASSPPHFPLLPGETGSNRSRSRSRSVSAAPTPLNQVYNGPGDGKYYESQNENGDEGENEDNGEDDDEEEDDDGGVGGEDGQGDDDEDEYAAVARDNAEMKEKLRVLLAHFDEQQMDRYEAYRRSGLAKASVRKLVNQVLAQSVSPTILTVVRGFSKVFVGEIVEKARSIAHHPGSLTPADIREAYRLYQLEHEGSKGTGASTKRKLFVK